MKCPICGQELTRSKKDPNYLLCYNCKKKFRVAQKSEGGGRAQNVQEASSEQETQSVQRSQSTQAVGRRSGRSASREEAYEDDYDESYDPYEEDRPSNVPIVVLGIAIVVVLGLIAVMLVL